MPFRIKSWMKPGVHFTPYEGAPDEYPAQVQERIQFRERAMAEPEPTIVQESEPETRKSIASAAAEAVEDVASGTVTAAKVVVKAPVKAAETVAKAGLAAAADAVRASMNAAKAAASAPGKLARKVKLRPAEESLEVVEEELAPPPVPPAEPSPPETLDGSGGGLMSRVRNIGAGSRCHYCGKVYKSLWNAKKYLEDHELQCELNPANA